MGFDKTTRQWKVTGAAPSQEAAPRRHATPNGQPQRSKSKFKLTGKGKHEGQELLDDAAPIYRLVNPLS